jgi:leader peptidase (prepilin peptidase)/N-methyltransferase
MTALAIALGFAFGASIGSFLTVVVHRGPKGLSIVSPGSACDGCGRPLRWFENVPIVSWVLLRARCRTCGARVPAIYPMIELTAGIIGALIVAVASRWFG